VALTDFLGQVIDVGDRVIYAAQRGRAVNMVLAEVLKFNDSGAVTVQPLKSSRWKQHYDRVLYIDSRTGKGIDLWSSSKKHIESGGYYIWADTKERPTEDELRRNQGFGGYYSPDPSRRLEWVREVFKPYVQRVVTSPAPVVLRVTDNIIKWNDGGNGDPGGYRSE
jgi:hypothetical protein